jgi:hypothetical protein
MAATSNINLGIYLLESAIRFAYEGYEDKLYIAIYDGERIMVEEGRSYWPSEWGARTAIGRAFHQAAKKKLKNPAQLAAAMAWYRTISKDYIKIIPLKEWILKNAKI